MFTKRTYKDIWKIVVLLLLTFPLVIPLLREGFFVTDDGNWMIIRFSAFYEAFRDGQFPVRWLGRLNSTYGYPLPNFTYPLFMYIGTPLYAVGFGLINTIKIILGASLILSGIFMYAYLQKLFSKISSLVGAALFVWTPYHLYDIYTRGSVGEVLALTAAPFVLWQYERKSIFWTSIGVAAILLSHNTLALFFMLFFAGYIVLRRNDINIFFAAQACTLGIGLSAFFIIPAVLELKYTIFSQTQISDWMGYFATLNIVGYVTLCVLALSVLLLTRRRDNLAFFYVAVLTLTLFLSTSISTPVWHFIPDSLIQFPFRLLSISIIATALLAAFCVEKLKRNWRILTICIFALATLANSITHLTSVTYTNSSDEEFATNQSTTTVKNEYMPKWVTKVPDQMPENLVESTAEISDVVKKSNEISFKVETDDETVVRVNQVYFPNWKAYINDKQTEVKYPDGVIEILVPEGRQDIHLRFENTLVRNLANSLSIISLLVLITYFGVRMFKKNYNK